MSFNASLEVTEVVLRSLENVSKELAKRCILECASRHNFDVDEELRILGLDNVTVILKKKPVIKQKPVIKFSLPFLSSSVDKNGCNGIAFNEGLFTQCKKVRINDESFCKVCLGESQASENGEPKNGTVTRRSNSHYYLYEDSRGRMPPSYQDYMKKRGITQEDVLAEAEKQGLTIPLEHFASFTCSKKVVKKSKKSLIFEEDEEKADLFGNLDDLMEETLEDLSDDLNNVVLDDYLKAQKEAEKAAEREAKALEKAEAKALEKAEQKAEREAKAAQEKAEREAKLALEKAEREAKKAQEKADREAKAALEKVEREAKIAQKAQEKADKEAKLEQEKAEKAAKLAQDKADAKAARETKLAEEKAERAAKVAQDKADREAQKAKKPAKKPVEKVVEKPVEDTAPKKVTVKRLFYNGKQYLKSGENVLYDPDTKEEVGIWCEETQTILDLPDEFYEDDEDDDEN